MLLKRILKDRRDDDAGRTAPRPAFEEVLSQHLDLLYRVALRCCHQHRADAEDLIQYAVVRAFQAFPRLRHVRAARVRRNLP